MSWVSTVVIQMGDYKEECDKALAKLNSWLQINYHLGCEFEYLDFNKCAGKKYPECKVVWGGFNYLNHEEFIDFFKSLSLHNSLLTIKHEDYGPFVIIKSDRDDFI